MDIKVIEISACAEGLNIYPPELFRKFREYYFRSLPESRFEGSRVLFKAGKLDCEIVNEKESPRVYGTIVYGHQIGRFTIEQKPGELPCVEILEFLAVDTIDPFDGVKEVARALEVRLPTYKFTIKREATIGAYRDITSKLGVIQSFGDKDGEYVVCLDSPEQIKRIVSEASLEKLLVGEIKKVELF